MARPRSFSRRVLSWLSAALVFLVPLLASASPALVSTQRLRFAVHPDRVAMANELAESADTVLAEVERQLGAAPSAEPISVRIVHTDQEFRDAMPGGRTIEWAAGVAFPELGLVVLRINETTRSGIHDVFRHELSHIVLGRATRQADLPLWFVEGVAVQQAGERLAERWQRAAEATLTESLPPLDRIRDGFPADGVGADFAYAHSTAFVRFMLTRGGWGGIRALIAKVAAGTPFEAAFAGAYGVSRAAMEADFVEAIAADASWLPLLFGSGVLMAVLVALVSVSLVARRRAARRRVAAMPDPLRDEFA